MHETTKLSSVHNTTFSICLKTCVVVSCSFRHCSVNLTFAQVPWKKDYKMMSLGLEALNPSYICYLSVLNLFWTSQVFYQFSTCFGPPRYVGSSKQTPRPFICLGEQESGFTQFWKCLGLVEVSRIFQTSTPAMRLFWGTKKRVHKAETFSSICLLFKGLLQETKFYCRWKKLQSNMDKKTPQN